MTLRDFAWGTLVFGFPVVFWSGLLTLALMLATAAIMILNLHAKTRIPVGLHHKAAFLTIASAIIHMILALSAYF